MIPFTHSVNLLAVIAIFTLMTYYWVLRGRTQSTLKSSSGSDRNTFRVKGVPLDWDSKQLQRLLADRKRTVPVIRSLSPEIDNSSKTATVTFENLPLSPQSHQSERISLSKSFDDQLDRDQCLTLDKAFLGITTIHMPPPEDHKLDVVALSGLGGHAFGSFKERGGDYMWLRDSLPHDLTCEETGQSMARVMTYGYESSVAGSENIQNIEDLATKFHSSLLALATAPTMRPIILIAHSLGGLVVKQALMALSKSTNEDDQNLIRAIYGIVFFGVPHDGMDISSLLPMVGDGPNRLLIESIGHINSQILTIQQREFHKALGDRDRSEVFCFYETLKSPTARQAKNGHWEINGPTAVLVTKSSATHCRPWEDGAEHICAIARTHSNMVKFGPHDHEYANIRERLRGLGRRALTVRNRIQARTKFLVPYNENPDFVGRCNILNTLKQQLGLGQPQGPTKSRTRVAVCGLGGIGKTQVALAYVYWLRETLPNVSIFWVQANSAERFYQAYTNIAKEFNIPGHDDPKANLLSLVKIWLENRYRSRWLMVIDNADDTELFFRDQGEEGPLETSTTATHRDHGLGRYIPECRHGSIIITTRSKQTGLRLAPGKLPIKIGKMDDNEASLLLHGILEDGEISAGEISLLSSRLEHLPLALAQAAAFIQENGISLSEYFQLLDESDSALVNRLSEPFQTVGRDSETPHAVTATWIISFNQIKQRNPFDSGVLSFISLFHWQAIPREFVEDYCRRIQSECADTIEAAKITKALGTLKAFSFITEDKDRNINMHRLIQLVTRKWLGIKRAEFAQLALKTMSVVYPYGKFETSDECLRLLPHAYAALDNVTGSTKDEKMARATLLLNMGGYFHYRGQWDIAEQHEAEAARIAREEDDEEQLFTLTAMDNLATIYRDQGRLEEAEKLFVQVMETCKTKLGADHPNMLTSMANLASTYWNQGRWEEAEKLDIQVMETRKMKLGADHPDTLTSMGNLAVTYMHQGRWEEAEKLDIQVMETRKTKLGADHPDTLTGMGNLAVTYMHQGRWEEAEKLEKQVVETSKTKLGADHPDTLTSMGNLAATYRNQGRWEEAEKLEVQVMETRKIILGADHPHTLNSMANLAFTWRGQGRDEEALVLMEKCAQSQQKVLGTNHPDTISCATTLEAWTV
ncbi:hypothetical protein BGZ63DRAFT_488681 [Mariannaea sp. PMI_226]|nr:hypothetical protein BGZ63DRAFT_488681 [Mariannaea sp. PMI_226]